MKDKFKNLKYGIIILIVAMVISSPLLWKNFDYYSDDGIQHIAKSFLTKEAIVKNQSHVVLART